MRKSNVFVFSKRSRGLLSTGSYNSSDTKEEWFLLIMGVIMATVWPIIMGLFAFGSSSVYILAGVLTTGIGVGLIRYNYFPCRITKYFNMEDNLPRSSGELNTESKDEMDHKDAA